MKNTIPFVGPDAHKNLIVVNSSGDRERSLDGVLMRFQIDF